MIQHLWVQTWIALVVLAALIFFAGMLVGAALTVKYHCPRHRRVVDMTGVRTDPDSWFVS